jgi:alpha-D-xyloside xylohydrolase
MKNILCLAGIVLYLSAINADAQQHEPVNNGFKATINDIDLEIQFYSPEIVRILKSPEGSVFTKTSFSVIKEPEKTEVKTLDKEDIIVIASSKMAVHINKITGKISFFSSDEKPLLNEKDYGIQFTPFKDISDSSYIVRQAFMLDKDEAIYGIGQFQDGKMEQRNEKLYLLQDILITAIPFFQSVKGYGLFWDNYSPSYFTDNKQETSFESTVGDCADYYFMYGGNADGVIAQMRDLTGQVPMFPYWTYGYWQSRERYKSQDETVGVLSRYRELGVPIDGIIQDWQYWSTDNAYWNSMEFGNPEFPDPKAMIDEVHQLNAHIIISVWASFGPKTKPFKELDNRNMLLNFTTWPLNSGVKVYDAYNPEARDIYWKFLNKGIFSLGIDGWWLDSSEPDHFDRKESDYDNQTYLGSFRKYRNLFPLVTVGGVYDHQRQETSGKRVFILTRSAFAGQQRYGANSWSGDVVSDWPEYKNQISAGLNFSLCGIPYWNSDIGGFFVWRYPGKVNDPAYKELYVRWLQFGAFCPMMRSHGTDTPREIYQFGEKGTWAYDAIEKYINLRYRFLPYIYSVSWDVTENSSSMMRALMMDFVDDKKALDINDQFMFGKSILVSPVTEPMYTKKDGKMAPADFSEVKSRELYLPAGTKWIDFWTGETFEGGQNIAKSVPVDIIPLYIKSGSIIPMGPLVQYANERIDPTEIRIFPGASGEFILYDDERDNYNYEKGLYSTIRFAWDDEKHTLTIGNRNGSFPGMAVQRIFNIVLVKAGQGCGVEPFEKPDRTIKYTGKQKVIQLQY